ncbi:HD domain-containing phosphohydrolase [Oribacterium sp. C9]|uniref:HD domain-containing phosphohydrolase n=1 Tax=Oribacterium sp. C9 TaxID=1943579 RepID=UPI00098F8DFF|nr:HD domain-containing phosphohydrolase [Oribacterium sp. C9]
MGRFANGVNRMRSNSGRYRRGVRMRIMSIVVGVCINIMLSAFAIYFKLPLYLNTIGTMCTAWIGGIFPGVMTAFFTNLICEFYSYDALYFSLINVLTAIYVVYFRKKHEKVSVGDMVIFSLVSGFSCGLMGSLIELFLYRNISNYTILGIADHFRLLLDISPVMSLSFANISMHIIDKGLSLVITLFIIRAIPNDIVRSIRDGVWRQRPLSEEELKDLRNWGRDIRLSSRTRMTFVLIGLSTALLFIVGSIGVNLFFKEAKTERTETAQRTVKIVAEVLDTDRLEEYLTKGRAADGYAETEEILRHVCVNAYGVEKLRVVKVMEGGAYFVFDLDKNSETEQHEPGSYVPIKEEFKPYNDDFLMGNEIEPIQSRDDSGVFLNIYYPLRNKGENTGYYVGAEISFTTVAMILLRFLNKMGLILVGFFVLIIVFVTWMTDMYVEYPISSLARCVDRFASAGYDQETLDENVMTVRKLGIHTGDEVEKLYHAVCQMTLNQAEQMRNVRRLSESTAQMQDGIIITMANMLENRDSDTGAHIQKTAAYVKIIAEGLRRKGYYAEKITPRFISEVVRSAPLHDVGKISITDRVLNKPGKLTDEEYEIMKTHTIAGKKIMETAISTVHGESYLREARNMAAYHHERWDGKGYPEGLHGEGIPLSARIMAVADVFDALTSPRVYKPAFTIEKALRMVEEGAGTQFDPKCVEVFMEALSEVEAVFERYNANHISSFEDRMSEEYEDEFAVVSGPDQKIG